MASNYNARRAPNVSQYLANLNTIPDAQELASQAELSLGDDGLDFLTNAEFFDFDQFHSTAAFEQQQRQAQQQQQSQRPASSDLASAPKNGPPFQFSEFQPFPMLSPTPLALQGNYPLQQGQSYVSSPTTGEKRKGSFSTTPLTGDLEESSRMAAEEDKRRRNTAASARFRVKKKQREQALEKQAKDMSDKVQQLESKVQQLEMENKWLKELITEKSETKIVESKKAERSDDARKSDAHTDGVGTAAVVEA